MENIPPTHFSRPEQPTLLYLCLLPEVFNTSIKGVFIVLCGCVLYLVLPPLDRWLCIVCHLAFLFFFFWHGPFLKSLLNLLQHCLCSISGFLAARLAGCQLPKQGSVPTPPRLEGEVSTTGLPGKSLPSRFLKDSKIKAKKSQLPLLLLLILLKFLLKYLQQL